MSEQNQQEPSRTSRPSARRVRSADEQRALRSMDAAQESAHQAERAGDARRDGFYKDDRRSSELLTERERSERWPLG